MRFESDPTKDQLNLDKHGVSLGLASDLDWDAALLWIDDRREYGETRILALAPWTSILYYVALNWSPNCGHHDWHEALSMVGRFGRLRRTGTGRRWETRYSPQVL